MACIQSGKLVSGNLSITRIRALDYFGVATINLAPCSNVAVFGVLQIGPVTLTFVSGISAEGSDALETLKVFMQFMKS
jgi:hypothetical protein